MLMKCALWFRGAVAVAIVTTTSPFVGSVDAQALSGEMLVKALQRGGYVILMRHAASPRETPTKETANADNLKLERQLDEAGRASAIAMGKALRTLEIPIGEVFTSPTYRAIETVKYAELGKPTPAPELGDGGQSMQGSTEAQSAWLQKKVTQFSAGKNVILVTHMPNISRAFPALAAGVADGESLVFGPDGQGGATVVGRIKIEEWPRFK